MFYLQKFRPYEIQSFYLLSMCPDGFQNILLPCCLVLKITVFRILIRIYVFGPPRSRSVIYLYRSWSGSGSGSFHQQAKKCFVTSLLLLSLKNYVNVPSKRNKHKNLRDNRTKYFLFASWRSLTKKQNPELEPDPDAFGQRYGSVDPNSYQNATDPEY